MLARNCCAPAENTNGMIMMWHLLWAFVPFAFSSQHEGTNACNRMSDKEVMVGLSGRSVGRLFIPRMDYVLKWSLLLQFHKQGNIAAAKHT